MLYRVLIPTTEGTGYGLTFAVSQATPWDFARDLTLVNTDAHIVVPDVAPEPAADCGGDGAQRDTREVLATGMTNSGAGRILYALLGRTLLRLVPYNQVY